jgi:hypothetical protein
MIRPGDGDAECAREHEAEHVAAFGAERHAHANLATALRHRVGHQSEERSEPGARPVDRTRTREGWNVSDHLHGQRQLSIDSASRRSPSTL